MSTKIYNAFIVKTENSASINTLMAIAQNARTRMLENFKQLFSEAVLIKMFKAIDLVTFYGNDIDLKNKFQDKNLSSLIENWIRIKNTYGDETDMHKMLWHHAVDSMHQSLNTLEQKYHSKYHKASILFIPCNDKTLGMYFGDSSYENILFEDTENIADYHYQDQTDQPDDISDEEWKMRKHDWDIAIGPDYIPINHGFEFQLLDHNNVTEDMLIWNPHTIDDACKNLDKISAKRIRNVLDTVDCTLFPYLTDKSVSEQMNIINKIKHSPEYKTWKTENEIKIAGILNISIPAPNNISQTHD